MTATGKPRAPAPRVAAAKKKKTPAAPRKKPAGVAEGGDSTWSIAADAAGVAAPEGLRKKELVDKVVIRSGVKKKDAKPVVEAMLAELGEQLAAGREMILPPLGKLQVNREKAIPNGQVMVVKIRRKTPVLTIAPETDAPD